MATKPLTPFPIRYKDAVYSDIDAKTSARLGLPVGMLEAIRTAGERSNADQVSSAGARTPYQIIPETRNAILKQYGIDAYLSPEMASEAAGILLRDSLKRSGNDPERAVREYHGGTDPKNWGKVNQAYWERVSAAMQDTALKALSADFGKWMADNPAQPVAIPAPAQAATPDMASAFQAWLKGSDQIPGTPVPSDRQPPALGLPPQQVPQAPGIVDKAIGTGEAALSAITGATGGALGMVGGAVKGAADVIASGQFGTPQGANAIEQAASQGAQALTYAPRTDSGQDQTAALGQAMNAAVIPAAAAAMGGPRMPAGSVPVAVQAVRVPAAAVLDKAATALPAAVREMPGRVADMVRPGQAPTPGTLGSVGSAGTDMAAQRTMAAQQLPVPVRLTTGQSSRNFEQLRFEGETAKDPRNGAALREFADQQRDQLLKNFDAFVDMTGAEAPDVVAAGRSVTGALTKGAARDKAEIRAAYKQAEKAGEMASPVNLQLLVDYLNEAAPEAATAPLLTTARAQAIKLGIAQEQGGRLVLNAAETMPGDSLMNTRPSSGVTLKTAETFRQAINRNTDFEPTNIRQATIIKGLVDQATENQGGDLYRAARALRRKFAEKYEDRAVIADLITNRKGMADPKVAADKVFQRSILQASPDDVLFLRRTLQAAGPDGVQAWREMQGATLRHIRDEATRGAGSDQRGNPLISVAGLDNAVKTLDKNGRLPILFGKQGAQQLRDIADIAKVINTVPPGAINTSNTASVLLAALTEAGVTGSMTGLPVPVLSGLRAIALQVKDRRIQQRVQAALRNEALRQQSAPSKAAPPAQAPGSTAIH